MKYVVFRIPTRLKLAKTYYINDKTALIPAGKFSQNLGPQTFFANSFWYAEEVSDVLTALPLENLKKFIRFWSFVFGESLTITHFEIEEEHPKFSDCLPPASFTTWEGHNDASFDPDNVKLRIELIYSDKKYNLQQLFTQFLDASKELKDLIEMYNVNLNRYVVNQIYCLYDNYSLKTSLNCIILDALTDEDRCGFNVECPKGCTNSYGEGTFNVEHPKTSFRQRIENLLKHFEDKDFYINICIFFWTEKRNKVFHKGYSDSRPSTRIPPIDPLTRMSIREATIDETIQELSSDGLSADNAKIIFSDIIYTLLMNKVFSGLNLWPKFTMLKMASFNNVASGAIDR